MNATIRVLVVDDQALIRAGFSLVVNAQPDMSVVAEASDGLAAVSAAAIHRPDIILMDIRMPDVDGIEATTRILAGVPSGHGPRILALTTWDADDVALQVLRAGASGFILKDTTAEALAAAIRATFSGDTVVAPSTASRLIRRLASQPDASGIPDGADGAASPPGPGPELTCLSDREREVFGHLALGSSNAEIAEALGLAEVTIKTHVGGILSKLGLRDRVHVVIWAYESGVVRAKPDAARLGTPRQ